LWASESICYEGRSATTRFVQTDESLSYPITLLGVTNDEFVLEGAMDNLKEVALREESEHREFWSRMFS
jgi:hypothetical protein